MANLLVNTQHSTGIHYLGKGQKNRRNFFTTGMYIPTTNNIFYLYDTYKGGHETHWLFGILVDCVIGYTPILVELQFAAVPTRENNMRDV